MIRLYVYLMAALLVEAAGCTFAFRGIIHGSDRLMTAGVAIIHSPAYLSFP